MYFLFSSCQQSQHVTGGPWEGGGPMAEMVDMMSGSNGCGWESNLYEIWKLYEQWRKTIMHRRHFFLERICLDFPRVWLHIGHFSCSGSGIQVWAWKWACRSLGWGAGRLSSCPFWTVTPNFVLPTDWYIYIYTYAYTYAYTYIYIYTYYLHVIYI